MFFKLFKHLLNLQIAFSQFSLLQNYLYQSVVVDQSKTTPPHPLCNVTSCALSHSIPQIKKSGKIINRNLKNK